MHITRRALQSALIALGVAAGTPIAAQSSRTIELGILAGPSFSTMKGARINPELTSHTGVMAGLSLVVSGTSPLALELNALYASKGFRSTGGDNYFELGTGFIEVPMLLRVQRSPAKSGVRPFAVIGPAFGVRVTCGFDSRFDGVDADMSCDQHKAQTGEAFAKTAISGVVGAGVVVPAGGVQLTVGGRFTRTFSNATTDGDDRFESYSVYLGVTRNRKQ